jgi:hypothetical protein
MAYIAATIVINDESQQPQLSVRRKKSNLISRSLLDLSCIYRHFAGIFTSDDEIFSSTTLKTLYEPCEFENERLLAFIDNPDFGPKDGGYLDRGKFRYKPKIVEQPLLFAQFAERPEQQFLLLGGINVSVLQRRIDQRHLVYIIEVFALLPPIEILVDMTVYDSL